MDQLKPLGLNTGPGASALLPVVKVPEREVELVLGRPVMEALPWK